MYGAGNKFFPRSRFARDKDRRITWRDFGDARKYSFQSRRGSNNLFEHRGFGDFFTQGDVLLLQFLLSSFAVFDIGARNIPTRNLSIVVVHWIETRQKPAITSIAFAHPQLQFVSRARRRSTIHSGSEPLHIIRMNVIANPPSLPPLIQTHSKVIERGAIGVKTFATGSEYRYMLRREVQDLPKPCFLVAAFVFSSLAIFNVGQDAIPFDDVASLISQGEDRKSS